MSNSKVKFWQSQKAKNFFFKIMHPASWYDQLVQDIYIDEFVNKLMQEGVVKYITSYYVVSFLYKEQEVKLWIGNFPFNYGSIYEVNGNKFSFQNHGPSMKTRYKLAAYLAAKKAEQCDTEIRKLFSFGE